jgi:hypothetical protein
LEKRIGRKILRHCRCSRAQILMIQTRKESRTKGDANREERKKPKKPKQLTLNLTRKLNDKICIYSSEMFFERDAPTSNVCHDEN